MKNILFSYELLYPPYDEGVKNLAFMIYNTLKINNRVSLTRNIPFLPNIINTVLIIPRLIFKSIISRTDKVVYIPKGALTFSAIIKVWLIGLFIGNKLVVVSVQRRILSPIQKEIVKLLTINNVFTLSTAMADELSTIDISAEVLSTGIDQSRFTPDTENIQALRKKYNLPEDKKILLHVGHIRESRNILWLLDAQKLLPEVQIVIIGSTTTQQDEHVRIDLEATGIIILREAFEEIQEIYQASDVYCFPVTELQGAMEIPLSVLEAMAVNLPVITTRFGRLPELFKEDEFYRYVDSASDIISILKDNFLPDCTNRKKVSEFTWNKTAEKLINT